ncbi:MAG: hypothetical protein H0T41_06345 [Rhodobacteraceae bacterium]|nr:hypothetical protein [Paracoccaceae bacterium]
MDRPAAGFRRLSVLHADRRDLHARPAFYQSRAIDGGRLQPCDHDEE